MWAPDARPEGARARALSEDLRFESSPGAGTSVVLEFTATQILFNEERGIDLSELDYLDPATARRVLLSAAERLPPFSIAVKAAITRQLTGAGGRAFGAARS